MTDLSSALESLLQNLSEPEPDIGNRRLRNFFHETYQPYRLSESSEKTLSGYVHTIERFALFLKRPATLDDLTDDSYYRMSTDRQHTSIQEQKAEVTQLARAYGYNIIREYPDEGISG